MNLRIFPSTRAAGAVGTTNCDMQLKYDMPPATGVTAVAYTNNVSAASATELSALDTDRDDLAFMATPNNGLLASGGSLEPTTTALAGFDIQTVGGQNTAYVALTKETGASFSKIFSIDLATGETTDVASLGRTKTVLKGIAL